jgi:glycosyltransferase involved in cell wall biosynthesis
MLVPPGNVDALEVAVSTVIGNERLREHMGSASRSRAEERFGVTRNARRILDYLQGIVDVRRSVAER